MGHVACSTFLYSASKVYIFKFHLEVLNWISKLNVIQIEVVAYTADDYYHGPAWGDKCADGRCSVIPVSQPVTGVWPAGVLLLTISPPGYKSDHLVISPPGYSTTWLPVDIWPPEQDGLTQWDPLLSLFSVIRPSWNSTEEVKMYKMKCVIYRLQCGMPSGDEILSGGGKWHLVTRPE